jgi:4'-phosphopantetheinyl transferase EntD
MRAYWITAELTRRAFLNVEAESINEARALAEQLAAAFAYLHVPVDNTDHHQPAWPKTS